MLLNIWTTSGFLLTPSAVPIDKLWVHLNILMCFLHLLCTLWPSVCGCSLNVLVEYMEMGLPRPFQMCLSHEQTMNKYLFDVFLPFLKIHRCNLIKIVVFVCLIQ